VPLEVLWYIVIIIAMIAYTVLDGFDLGVGALHLFVRKDVERRIFMNAIGPVWDGNEVWLVIVIGALFAGFPNVYATTMSAFYNLVMGLITGLIFRAVAIEFRSKVGDPRWRNIWDVVFCVSSIMIAFGMGFVLGNLIEGIPLNENQDFVGTSADFWKPYPILLGFTSVALFMMHGAIFLAMKTEGELHQRLRKWTNYLIGVFFCFYAVLTALTLATYPHMTDQMVSRPYLFIVPLLALLTILNVPLQMKKGNDGWAFLSSCLSIALLLVLFAIGTYPTIVRSSINPEIYSLTAFNTASSRLTLTVLLIIVAIGVPLVLAYGAYIYRVFRGKVKLDKTSY